MRMTDGRGRDYIRCLLLGKERSYGVHLWDLLDFQLGAATGTFSLISH